MPRGQTPKQRRFRRETKPLRKTTKSIKDILNKFKQEPGMVGMPTGDNDRINDVRDKIADTMESFLSPLAGVGSMAGSALKRAKRIKPAGRLSTDDLERDSKKRGGKMSTGGEVDIDMTTEVEVE